MKKTILAKYLAVALAAGLTSFAGSAKAELIYNNLRTLPYYGGDGSGGDRITSSYRGEAQSFVASKSASIATAAFQLYKLDAATGSMTAKLFSVSGNSIGSQVGQACGFNVNDIKGPYTAVNVSSFNWNVDAGQKYALALIGGSDFYNPNGGGDGVYWIGGSGSKDNLNVFNNWYTPSSSWENWGSGNNFSAALFTEVVSSYAVASTAAVPEPSQVAASLLLAAGIAGFVIVKRRQEGSDLEALVA